MIAVNSEEKTVRGHRYKCTGVKELTVKYIRIPVDRVDWNRTLRPKDAVKHF